MTKSIMAVASPLTRRFYVLDEVAASLFYTTSRGHRKESVFWCRELIESGYIGEAISILFESWLWHRGPFHLSWFMEAFRRLSSSEVTAEDILFMADSLSGCPIKDHSLWTLFACSVVDVDSLLDRVTPRSPSSFPSDDASECFLIRAIFQHKAQSAWRMALTMESERLWSLFHWYVHHLKPPSFQDSYLSLFTTIRQYDQLLGYSSPEYDRAMNGLALLSLCLSPSQQERSFQVLSSSASLSGYFTDCRDYSIPHYGLYAMGKRGCLPQTSNTWDHLHDVEMGIQGCPFWEEAKEPYYDSKKGGWLSDDAREAFYCQYFPNDIPDEWTRVEKEKSHGDGMLQKGEAITLWGYMRRYMMGQTRLVWGKGLFLLRQTRHVEELDRVGIQGVSPFLALLSLIPLNVIPIPHDMLRPVHKKKVVS